MLEKDKPGGEQGHCKHDLMQLESKSEVTELGILKRFPRKHQIRYLILKNKKGANLLDKKHKCINGPYTLHTMINMDISNGTSNSADFRRQNVQHSYENK